MDMLLSNLNLLATAPGGVARLRELILTLAVQGKLVPQDPKDEPASELLKKISAEKDRLIAEGKIKRDKPLAEVEVAEMPFELPSGWMWEKFGTIAGIERGGSPRPIESFLTNDPSGLNWIKIGDTEKGGKYITHASQKIKREGLVKTRMVFPGDFLLTNSMSFGRPYITQIEGCIHDGWLRISPPSSLNKDFLYVLLSSRFIRNFFEAAAAGGVVLNLNADKVRTVPIPLPPLAEQSRIVTRVDELMRLCDALEAKGQLEATQHAQLVSTLLGTLTASGTPEELAGNWQRIATHFDLLLDRPEAVDALEQTILQLAVQGLLVSHMPVDEPASKLLQRVQRARTAKRRVVQPDAELLDARSDALPVGWTWASIDQVSADTDTAITDGPFGANLKTEHYVDACGFRVIRLQNIGEGSFRKEHHAYIESDRYERLTKHQISGGDIVVAGLVDKSIRCCIVPPDIGPAIVKADCYRFSVHESFSTKYICLYLSSRLAHEFAATHHHGLTLTRIGLGNFRTIPVPVPPAAEQARIVARVAQLHNLCAALRQRLTSARERRSQLAQALVEQQSAADT
jgi:type I restriction enzyme S subunit